MFAWYMPVEQLAHAIGPIPIFQPVEAVDASELQEIDPPTLIKTTEGPEEPEYAMPFTDMKSKLSSVLKATTLMYPSTVAVSVHVWLFP